MLMASDTNPALKYGVALVAAAVVAAAISRIVQFTGEQTALRGIKVAAMLWVGFVLTTWGTEYAFEVRTLCIYAINDGFWLLGMPLMGAIVGAEKEIISNPRRIKRQLVVLLVGTLHRHIVQQQRRRQHRLRHIAKVVGHKQILARGLHARAQRALIQIVQLRAAHQFALAIRLKR